MSKIKVGDTVFVDNDGNPGNFEGGGEVVLVYPAGTYATVRRLEGTWGGYEEFDFLLSRLTLVSAVPRGAWAGACGAGARSSGSLQEYIKTNVAAAAPLVSETVDEYVERMHGTETKATNPKDAIGSDKLPLHLWPETATVMGTLGLLDGMLKYGRSNWREAGVRATIYIDAVKRHINAFAEGEDNDPDSGAPHLAHALACLAILVDAQAAGKLTDDRAYNGAGYRKLVEELTPHVARLKVKHVDKTPKHYTIADAAVQA